MIGEKLFVAVMNTFFKHYFYVLFCRCSSIEYPGKLPSASIIICFYNEEFHTLIRSIHSVIERSNPQNLNEIILVDDYSDIGHSPFLKASNGGDFNSCIIFSDTLHEDLEKYLQKNFSSKVQLYKTPRREGLIRARIFGAGRATGDVCVKYWNVLSKFFFVSLCNSVSCRSLFSLTVT